MAFKLSELFGRKKKYPFNKKNPPAAVYAGPEYFARRSGQKRDEGEVVDVYAQPFPVGHGLPPLPAPEGGGQDLGVGEHRQGALGQLQSRRQAPHRHGAAARRGQLPVRQAPEGPEEDAPLPPEDEETYAAVYAGPEPPEEGEADAPAKKPGLLVYAGPEFFARKADKAPDVALAVGVYAGPEPPPGGMMGMMGMMGGPSPTPSEDEGKADGEA